MAVGTLTQLILECEDPEELAAFWRTVLDLDEPERDEDWVTLAWEPVGRLSFHHVPDYRRPEWPGEKGALQVHFDLLVEDLDEASATVLSAGANPLSGVMGEEGKPWRIFSDPAGHPFCLVTVPE